MSDEWNIPISKMTFVRVITCTNSSKDFAVMICTMIDLWAEDHGINKIKFAAEIAERVKRKVETNGNCK